MKIELMPHQQKAVDEMHNGCILCGDVGSGKTFTSLAYFWTKICGGVLGDYDSMRTPTDLYVITTAKKRDSLDWEKDAANLGLSDDRLSSVNSIQITVDSWNNIEDYEDVSGAFFVFDEQRVVGSGAWVKSFYKIARNNKWILLSATPGDNWIDYIPVFVANGFYKNRTEFKREHVVYSTWSKFPKVERYLGVNRLVKLKNQILVDMPFDRHTVRHSVVLDVDYDVELFKKVTKERWHVYEERPIRDVAELFAVMRRVVNSDDSRLSRVRTLMKAHPRLIVFYNFNYELEMLRGLAEGLDVPAQTVLTEVCGFHFKGLQCFEPLPCVRHEGLSPGMTITREDPPWDTSSKQMYSTLTPTSMMRSSVKSPATSTRSSQTESLKISQSQQTLEEIQDPIGCAAGSSTCSRTPMDESLTIGSSRSSSDSSFAIAEWNGHKHQPIPDTERWIYLVQYRAGAEGWNCVETDTVVFYSLTYSYKDFHQSHGRIDRLNTSFTDLWYYILRSKASIDRQIWSSLKQKKNFNEKEALKEL